MKLRNILQEADYDKVYELLTEKHIRYIDKGTDHKSVQTAYQKIVLNLILIPEEEINKNLYLATLNERGNIIDVVYSDEIEFRPIDFKDKLTNFNVIFEGDANYFLASLLFYLYED